MSRKYVTTPDEMITRVTNDYFIWATDLCSLHFSFWVDMDIIDILEAYGEIQARINGDEVIFPDDVSGHYKGSCRLFLESLNDVPGYIRTNAYDGEVVDFVF